MVRLGAILALVLAILIGVGDPARALVPGERSTDVLILRINLAELGHGARPAGPDGNLFDPSLQQALMTFQRSAGLPVTGTVDGATRTALDRVLAARDGQKPVAAAFAEPQAVGRATAPVPMTTVPMTTSQPRSGVIGSPGTEPVAAPRPATSPAPGRPVGIPQVAAVTDRAASPVGSATNWAPAPSGLAGLPGLPAWRRHWPAVGRAVVVDIDAAEVYALEDGAVVLVSRAIVGKPDTPTPGFSTVIESVTFNPSWTVPPGIARRQYGGRSFTVRPGPGNPLGRIKLQMPNHYLVYLHDTPDRHLFERSRRRYSSGCVRVQRIEDLAYWLLGPDRWASVDADRYLTRTRRTRTVRLDQPVPVYLE